MGLRYENIWRRDFQDLWLSSCHLFIVSFTVEHARGSQILHKLIQGKVNLKTFLVWSRKTVSWVLLEVQCWDCLIFYLGVSFRSAIWVIWFLQTYKGKLFKRKYCLKPYVLELLAWDLTLRTAKITVRIMLQGSAQVPPDKSHV